MIEKRKSTRKFKLPEAILILMIIVSGVLLAFSSGKFVVNLKQVGFSFVSSIEKGIFYVKDGVVNTVTSVKELHKLKKEYNELIVKLSNYEQMQRSNVEIRKENERLKELLGFASHLEQKNIPAQIISRDLDSTYTYITINKGSVNGIKKGMAVVAFQGGTEGLVGKIVQVGPFTSQLMPVYNPDNIVSARILNSRDLGLVNGLGSSEKPLMLKYIRKRVLDKLSYGDIIVTSGENDNYIRDIPIGTISKITVVDYNSSLDIELTPIIDFARLENVVVINSSELNDMLINSDSSESNLEVK